MRVTRCHGVNGTKQKRTPTKEPLKNFRCEHCVYPDRESVSEPTAVFAVGEFAEAVGDKRRSEDRKSVVPALEFFQTCSLNDK